MKWLLGRLGNEEESLLKSFPDLTFEKRDYYSGERGKVMKLMSPRGVEKLEVVRKYTIKGLRAKGFVGRPPNLRESNLHDFEIYILRNYPYSFESREPPYRLYVAPIRTRYLSNIFHPNIEPGPSYGYDGVVCWAAYQAWLPVMTLPKIVEAFKMLIENPNPDDPLNVDICLEAARWFKYRGVKLFEKKPSIPRRGPRVLGVR